MKTLRPLKIKQPVSKKMHLWCLEMPCISLQTLAIWCMGILLSACTVGPDFQPLKPAVPDHWIEQIKSTPNHKNSLIGGKDSKIHD